MLKAKFDGLMVKLASPDDIKGWSQGTVESPDTINYRTGKPKQKGLFCETIFGPMRNYECSCGKYKGVRYKGIICERCLVEVTSTRVRRERMGHIDLAVPVVHIWYVKATPSRIGLLLDLSVKEIEKILYFVKYIVTNTVEDKQKKNAIANLDKDFEAKLKELDKIYKDELKGIEELSGSELKAKKNEKEKLFNDNKGKLEKEYSRVKSILANLKVGSTILESDYRNIFYKYEGIFRFESGAAAIENLLKEINIEADIKDLLERFAKLKGPEREKSFKKLRLLINLHISGVRPEWMVIKFLPVIPPDLRPVVQLEGGKFASSDINLYYRRVLMRNLRLNKMIQAGMPAVIRKNEIRLLQEAVNNLIIGERDAMAKMGAGVKVFKSLTDMLSGKEGIFRKNLLGKRVDYSGRSVITVGPNLKLNECGLPLYIAVRIFTPFIIGKLIERKISHTPKQAEKLIKDESPIALKILEDVIKDKYVLLNRAPTLHRLGIQAFKIKLMPGKTIRVHPLVCPAFNADFDGDQMAVHLPLSDEAQQEAATLISSEMNILKPASGEPIITHTQDMILGVYYLTSDYGKSENIVGHFSSISDVVEHYYASNLNLLDTVSFRFNGEVKISTVGRVLFNNILPDRIRFVDEKFTKKQLKKLLDKIYDQYGREETVRVADELKDRGFKYATLSSITINIFDIRVPAEKKALIEDGEIQVSNIHNFWYKGFLSDDEKHRSIIKIWSDVKAEIEKKIKRDYKDGNNIYKLIDSGARGNRSQLTQLSGMKGLVASPSGEIIELPIKSSLIEGFSPIEYFISAHGARKGKADTALRTAESGYLTRRLVDASQEVVLREEDCGATEGLLITKEEAELRQEDFGALLFGRTLLDDLYDDSGKLIVKGGTLLDKETITLIEKNNITKILVRSPLTCLTTSGVCQKCFGMDLSTRKEVEIGTGIGIIASQSIGEPGTQLTMRTFHSGGIASSDGDITQGIKRVEELFEVRKPKKPAIIAPFDGVISLSESGKVIEVEITSDPEPKRYIVKPEYKVTVKVGDILKRGGIYGEKGKSHLKVKEEGEVLEVQKDYIVLGVINRAKRSLSVGTRLLVKPNDFVYKGQILSSGALDVKEFKEIVGDIEAQKYIVREIKKVFTSQGQEVDDKYMEIIVKQLFGKVLIEDTGDSSFIPGSIIKYEDFQKVNIELKDAGKIVAKGERLVLGLTQVAKESDSWLSAASFQETMRVMVDSSTKGSVDRLDDLKSNVIIGRLLPIGKPFKKKLIEGENYIEDETYEDDSIVETRSIGTYELDENSDA